jgi:hypothetical protein
MIGVPAVQAGWICECGIRLPQGKQIRCSDCGRQYQIANGLCCEAPPLDSLVASEIVVPDITTSNVLEPSFISTVPVSAAA